MSACPILTMLGLCLAGSGLTATLALPDVMSFDAILQAHVRDDGRVRYGALRRNLAPLEGFVRQMSATSPHSHPELFPSKAAKLAYWINAYNALVLLAFAQDYPEKKERLGGFLSRGYFFYQRKFIVGGQKRSLAAIENNTIRKEFRDPRIHFAIVCASASCPWLARRAYTADTLEPMLEAETRRFLNQPRNVSIDPGRRVVTLSKIFDWFREDFGTSDAEVLRFVARYRATDGNELLKGNWKVKYFDYDWSVNDAVDDR